MSGKVWEQNIIEETTGNGVCSSWGT